MGESPAYPSAPAIGLPTAARGAEALGGGGI
jgi:hypothetical protein